jgi:prepilin-type N-terminal cleavage/methylation domain-containing protein
MSLCIQSSTTNRRRAKPRRGFSLIEVMVATVLFSVIALSVTAGMIQAFKILARARYYDRAANVLRSVAEQFQGAKLRDVTAHADGTLWKDLFRPTPGGPTGVGMAWLNTSQTFLYPNAVDNLTASDYSLGVAAGLSVPLKTAGATDQEAPIATLTRDVDFVVFNVAGNALTTAFSYTEPSVEVGGVVLRGRFAIQYDYLGRTETITATVLRNRNPTDK